MGKGFDKVFTIDELTWNMKMSIGKVVGDEVTMTMQGNGSWAQ